MKIIKKNEENRVCRTETTRKCGAIGATLAGGWHGCFTHLNGAAATGVAWAGAGVATWLYLCALTDHQSHH